MTKPLLVICHLNKKTFVILQSKNAEDMWKPFLLTRSSVKFNPDCQEHLPQVVVQLIVPEYLHVCSHKLQCDSCFVGNISKLIVVASLDSNNQMFASCSVLELVHFDSGLLVSHPLYASTKNSFCVKRNLEKSFV